jgi:predicted methyltransferase
MRLLIALAAVMLSLMPARAQEDAALRQAVAAPHRAPQNTARDNYRNPYEVLRFFGLTDTMTVVEIHPGGAIAYWTEILGPYLKARGKYIAAVGDEEKSDEARRANPALRKKLADAPQLYEGAQVVTFGGGSRDITPPGGADMVLTFRNIHNWMSTGEIDAAMRAFYAALKPGGILGIEEHRGRTDQPQDPLAKSGYVRQDYMIELAKKAGFEFAGSSEVNANPRDTKDYSAGVWTLPPSYRLGDQDRAKYAAIGESDRFILKFVKPK